MPGETPEKPPLVKKTSIVGALRTGDVKGAVTGVLTAAPLLETPSSCATGCLRSIVETSINYNEYFF